MTTDPASTPSEAVQYWFDAATERREERDRLRAVVARIAQMADAWEQRLPETIRTPAVVSAIRAALEPAAAVPVAAPPTTEQEAQHAEDDDESEKLAKARRMAKALSAPPVAPPEWATTAEWPGRHKRSGDRRVHATARFVVNDTQRFWTACGEPVGRGGTPLAHMPVDCRACQRRTAVEAGQAGGPSREATEPQPETQTAADPLTVLTAPALLATIKELRDLRAPLIDALATVHQSMTSCVGDEWAMEWLGEVWSQLPLEVRAAAGDTDAADELAAEAPHTETPDEPAVSSRPGTEQEAQAPHTVCVCGHSRGEHVTVGGRLLCDECDPSSTDNLVCKEFEAL